MVRNKTVLLKIPVSKQTDSSQLHWSVKIECMHDNATCWYISDNYLTWPMLLGCRNPSASDVSLDIEVVRYLTRVRGTSVLVDTPLGIQLTRVSCTCSAFPLPYV